MERHYSQACRPCIGRHIGPALDRIIVDEPTETLCYGCGKRGDVFRFSYWFPWPSADEIS
jgi:hypothetical protein